MENISDAGNIFDKGCLVQLSIGVWGGAKKINEAKAQEALGSEWAKARKLLVDRESLKPIEKVRNEARTFIRSLSLPFPVDGILFVPFSVVSRIDDRLKELHRDYLVTVQEFTASYSLLVESARIVLGDLYDETDYPTDIERYFKFEWRFITLAAPGDNKYLSPDLIAREQVKFLRTMEKARQMGVMALREEFQTMVKRCCERLTPGEDGKAKRFKRSLTGNFVEFFESFKDRNIFNDSELDELVSRARGIVEGVEFESLRDNEGLKAGIAAAMLSVDSELEKSIENMPGRKLSFDD